MHTYVCIPQPKWQWVLAVRALGHTSTIHDLRIRWTPVRALAWELGRWGYLTSEVSWKSGGSSTRRDHLPNMDVFPKRMCSLRPVSSLFEGFRL